MCNFSGKKADLSSIKDLTNAAGDTDRAVFNNSNNTD